MESIIVEGGRPLEGKVSISGAKNSVLPLLAAAILFRGGCLLHNCPRLSDVAAAAEILEHLGCRVDRTGHSIWVDAQDLCRDEIPRALMERMRSSILFLGPLLARTGAPYMSQGAAAWEPGPLTCTWRDWRPWERSSPGTGTGWCAGGSFGVGR